MGTSLALLTASSMASPPSNGCAAICKSCDGPYSNVVDIASNTADLSTLVDVVTLAGLADTLATGSSMTIFAPTNEAFANLQAALGGELPSDTAQLQDILGYHIVSGDPISACTAAGLATPEGTPVMMSNDCNALLTSTADGGLQIGGANIIQTDICAENNVVVHVIDAVLNPEGATCGM